MKFLVGVLLTLVASAFAINLQIESTTEQDSDGFVKFSLTPPVLSTPPITRVQILLPGDSYHYSFKSCYNVATPNESIPFRAETIRTGFTSLQFRLYEPFTGERQTYACTLHTPKNPDYREVGIYMSIDGVEYFASAPGGTLPSRTPRLMKYFLAALSNSYLDTPSRFYLYGLLDINAEWVLRLGAPTNPSITVVTPVVFESIHPTPTCDLNYGEGENRVSIVVKAQLSEGAIYVTMPPKQHQNDAILVCHDFIFKYSGERTAVVQASDHRSGLNSFSFVIHA